MANRRSADPLVTLPLRVPASLRAMLVQQAAASHCTLSDALRAHLTLEVVKPIGAPRSRRRLPERLGRVSCVDPVLLRQLAAVGANLNQVARAVNTGVLKGTRMEVIDFLVVLRSIERHLDLLSSEGPHPFFASGGGADAD